MKQADFLNKKGLIFLILVIILAIVYFGFLKPHQNKESRCIENIKYNLGFGNTEYYQYSTTFSGSPNIFKTHDEAMEYCMNKSR